MLARIGRLINEEIDKLTQLEERTLSSDLSLGYALKTYTGNITAFTTDFMLILVCMLCVTSLAELLTMFVGEENIKTHYKRQLVRLVLSGYLALRRLVVQRTKLIDDAEEKLQLLLEELTTGAQKPSISAAHILGFLKI